MCVLTPTIRGHLASWLAQESGNPSFWDDPERAERLLKEKSAIESELDTCASVLENVDEAAVLEEMVNAILTASPDCDILLVQD